MKRHFLRAHKQLLAMCAEVIYLRGLSRQVTSAQQAAVKLAKYVMGMVLEGRARLSDSEGVCDPAAKAQVRWPVLLETPFLERCLHAIIFPVTAVSRDCKGCEGGGCGEACKVV